MLLTANLLCINAQLFMIIENQNNRINPFVNNEGFSAENNLVDILDSNDDNEEDQVISHVKLSTYLDTHKLSGKLYQAKSKLRIRIRIRIRINLS